MVVLRWVMRIVGLVLVLVGLVFVGARFHDGPLGPLPGGPLASGPVVAAPVSDWSFATDVAEIELQLASQQKSRTTWILVHEGKAYIPAATEFPPGKTWHRAALEDGRATLRIAGKRYPVTLAKVEDPALLIAVRDVALRKYPARPAGEVWLFAVTSQVAEKGPSASLLGRSLVRRSSSIPFRPRALSRCAADAPMGLAPGNESRVLAPPRSLPRA